MPESAWDFFKRRYEAVLGDWETRIEGYDKWYMQVLAQDTHGTKPWGAQINTRYTETQVRTHTSFTIAGLLPAEPWVYAEATSPYRLHPDVEPKASEEYNRRLQQLNFYKLLARWVRQADIYGLGVVRMGWSGTGVVLEIVNPSNLAWDSTAYDLESAHWIIEKYDTLTLQDIMEGYAAGQYGVGSGGQKGGYQRLQESAAPAPKESREGEIRTGRELPTMQEMDSSVELHDIITPDRIVTVHVDSQVVLKDIENPYRRIPYYDLCTYPEIFQVQGYGIPELIEGLQDEKDTARRQRTDIRSLEANPMITVKRGSGLNIYKMRSQPGRIIPVRDQDDVKPLQFQDTGRPLLEEEMLLQAEGDVLLGVMPHTRGQQGAQMKATVANLLHTNINTRFTTSMRDIQDYPFRRFFRDFVELCSNYDTGLSMQPPEWQYIRDLATQGLIRIVFHAEAHVGNPFAKIQLLLQVIQAAQAVLAPPGQAMIINQVLKLADIRDRDKITQFLMLPPPQGAQQGGQPATQGQGVAQTEEMARARAVGQPQMPMQIGAA